METLNLLKYWKTNSNRTTTATGDHKTTSSTAIVSTVKPEQKEAEPEDDGPFFDLKLAVAEQNVGELKIDDVESLESDDEELKATGCNGNGNGEEAAAATACAVQVVNSSEELQAAKPRFRVFMLGSNKSKSKPKPKSAEETDSPKQQEAKEESEAKSTKLDPESSSSKLFTVMKFRAEDVPFVSLFTKSASNNGTTNHKSPKQNTVESDRGENGFSTEVVHEYLKKKVKPLYIRISKPSINLKLGLNARAKAKAGAEAEAIGNVKSLVSGLRIGGSNNSAKSKTALAAVAAAPTVVISSRRDDSLLQQQDGIQSAILHCKRSFNDSN